MKKKLIMMLAICIASTPYAFGRARTMTHSYPKKYHTSRLSRTPSYRMYKKYRQALAQKSRRS